MSHLHREWASPQSTSAPGLGLTCRTIDSIGTPKISGGENASSSLAKTADEKSR
jgi:hypothetical protein